MRLNFYSFLLLLLVSVWLLTGLLFTFVSSEIGRRVVLTLVITALSSEIYKSDKRIRR